eukprot:m.13695 g.13695  ORF g.13695 m.13695 type:complete len:183 (+) comp4903_c0_seq2:90-638(+)
MASAYQQQVLQQALEQAVLQEVQNAEAQVDQKLHELNSMNTEEIEEIEAIRRRRIEFLKKSKERKQIGHGEYSEIGGTGNEKEFFDAAKTSDKMVCHFYRNGSPRCEIVDKHLSELAVKHLGTRFVKLNAEKAPFLAERLRIIFLPTICCVIKGKVYMHIHIFIKYLYIKNIYKYILSNYFR